MDHRDISMTDDLSALAWVQEELRRSLDGAHKALRRALRDAESLQGADVDALDPAVLRAARQQVHQGVGALEMVGLPAAAAVLRASESAIQRLTTKPTGLTASAVDAVERTSFALLDYVGRLLAGKPIGTVALFPQYRDMQELAGADRVHPADLWQFDWEWHALPADPTVPAREADAQARGELESRVLGLMRHANPAIAAAVSDLFAGLGNGAHDADLATLWRLAAAVYEAQAHELLTLDNYSKRLASRLLSQIRLVEQAQGLASERLAQDLLFFCAQARLPADGRPTPRLATVRDVFQLAGHEPVAYEVPRLGRFDPAVIAQARKRVAAAKEAWSAVAGGELHRLPGLAEPFQLLAESLRRLYPHGDALAEELAQAVSSTVQHATAPSPALAMEMATSVLYVEASLDDGELDHPELGGRVLRLAERVASVRGGRAPEPLEPWMEELYRRVSDRQTMGSVVQELRASLSEAERQIDQYFRQPDQRDVLIPVPAQLGAMRGVLSVLGMDHAASAVLRMRDEIDGWMARATDDAADPALFNRLAENLGALGFLIDMLSVQPQMAKSLFRYDAATGTLSPVMGRHQAVADSAAPRLIDRVQALAAEAARADVSVDDVQRQLERLSHEAQMADQPTLAATVSAARQALEGADRPEAAHAAREKLAQAISGYAAPAAEVPLPPLELPKPAKTAKPAEVPAADDDDAEMRDIFLEEAREVLESGREALEVLAELPEDVGQLTVVRRAFHTLKGSSRMVGLDEFGDAAWACEQLYNARLAEQPQADDALLGFTHDAFAYLGEWVDRIAAGTPPEHQAARVREAADALRLQGVRQALPLPADAGSAGFGFDDDATLPLPEVQDDGADALALPDLVTLDFDVSTPGALTAAPLRATPATAEDGPVRVSDADVAAHAAERRAGEPMALDLSDVSFGLEPATTPDDDATRVSLPAAAVHDALAGGLADEPLPPLSVDDATIDLPLDGAEVERIDLDLGSLDEAGPTTTSGLVDLSFDDTGLTVHDELGNAIDIPLEAPTAAPAAAAPVEEEGTKQIGPLRVPLPLFNIYLGEADDLSRRLAAELGDWAMALPQPPQDSTVALAHSLAGSSATVGYAELSQLARALEHALMRVQAIAESTPSDAGLFIDVAEEIRQLLHQFAGGFLKSPAAALWQRLSTHERESAERLERARAQAEAALTLDDEPLLPVATEAAPAVPTPPTIADAPVAAAALAPPTPAVAGWAELESEIDAIDAVDEELFPVFEEEGQELLPLLAGRLRDWHVAPQDTQHGTACMRTLHTLKGGARLAGAMRLGELAHRLETAIEQLLGRGTPQRVEIEWLQARADALVAAFEAMGRRDAEAYESAQAAMLAPASPVAVPSPSAAAPSARDASAPAGIDWQRAAVPATPALHAAGERVPTSAAATVRVRSQLLDRLVNNAGEVSITRTRLENEVVQLRHSLGDLRDNLDRLRGQLRDIELQAETQMSSRLEAAKVAAEAFDPLEFDRFTRFQEVTRMMAESVNDVATVQRNLQRALESTEDELAAQARLTRELQDDLLRTRMVEFDGLSDRLYRVVRLAAKETGKHVRLDVTGGQIEVDRGVLDRMTGAFEHLLRNCVTHGIERPDDRRAAGKDATGTIGVTLTQDGNEIAIEVRDDGRGLDLPRIRQKALASGLIGKTADPDDATLADLIFTPGFTTAETVTELAGRGIGMDVVRSEVVAMGGRIDTHTEAGRGTRFKLVLPLTTAVTKVVMLRCGEATVAVPSTLIEVVRRVKPAELEPAYASGEYRHGPDTLPFHWLGGLLQLGPRGLLEGRSVPVVIVRSAQQRLALHVDEVLGNQDVVVKNLGPQLSRIPGLTGMTLLASGTPALIYNPVALSTLYGEAARGAASQPAATTATAAQAAAAVSASEAAAPLILVVDDSLTVRRVTQRLLLREGYRVVLAKDGLEALERLAEIRPDVVLSDIEMPRMDGFDLVRNMRNDARWRDLPVIMITSRIAQKHRDHAQQLGVNHYLGKPYSEDDLLALIQRHVREESVT